ncbi:hypothetical protein [Streptomyces sp. NPDC015414]|uniref:hypothetical protein n=1 Tax=Streptomyces sp. NPDC015414 TaxID=3364957 RepID=UPI0036FC8F6F
MNPRTARSRVRDMVFHPDWLLARLFIAFGVMAAQLWWSPVAAHIHNWAFYWATAYAPAATATLIVVRDAYMTARMRLAELRREGRSGPRPAWLAPLLSLLGAVALTLPAACFPPRARKQWLGGVLESFSVRCEHDKSFLGVLASWVRTWPADLLDEWLDYLTRRPNDLDLTNTVRDTETPQASGSYWKRHRTEIVWAIVFAVVFAPLAAVAYEAVTETLHQSGYRWIWEVQQQQ